MQDAGDWQCKYAKVGTPTFEQLWRRVASGRIFGFLEHARETRFPVTKITSFVTLGWLAPYQTSPFRATGVPKTSEFAPSHESYKIRSLVWGKQVVTIDS